MTPRFQTRIQRYGWDKAAEHYEAGWKDSLAPAQNKLLELAEVQAGETVLDIACGTGLVTLRLAEAAGPNGQVVATDLSDRMVDIVRSEASSLSLANVKAFRADAERLVEVQDNSFDLVTCALGLMYCPDPMIAMQETLRVLKPGGRAVFAVWGARKNCGWADIFPIVDARVESSVCPMFFRLGTGNVLASEMALVGLDVTSEVRLSCDLPYASDEAAADAAFIGGPVALAYNRFDDDTRCAARSEYLSSIRHFRTTEGYAIPGEFVVCAGQKPH